jgi:outer membrane receptor protein involved in Fe transport
MNRHELVVEAAPNGHEGSLSPPPGTRGDQVHAAFPHCKLGGAGGGPGGDAGVCPGAGRGHDRRAGGHRPARLPWNDRYARLDVKASYAINERVQVFVEGQNLTDTKLRQYIGTRRDWVTNYERLRQTYYVGVQARW